MGSELCIRASTFTANASAQQARFDGGPFSGNDVPLVPEHTMELIADWQALTWLSAQISHRYVGDRHYDGDVDNEYRKLDHYRTTDLQLTARYRKRYLKAGVYNLKDNVNADYGNYNPGSSNAVLYPLPERHYRCRLYTADGADEPPCVQLGGRLNLNHNNLLRAT